MMKKCVEFNLRSFGTLKYDYVIKSIEILSLLLLINHSVTIGFNLLLLIISAIISSKTINILRFLLDCNLQFFCGNLAFHLNIP